MTGESVFAMLIIAFLLGALVTTFALGIGANEDG